MALSLGQMASSAGIIARGMREAEEAERVARQNQLAIEERNRLNQLRREGRQAPFDQSAPPMLPLGEQFPVRQIQPQPSAAPAALAASAAPAAPAAQDWEVAGPAYKTPIPGPSVAPRGVKPAQPTTAFPALSSGGLRATPSAAAPMGFDASDIALLQRALPATPTAPSASQSLVNAVIQVESGGNPNAVSPKGAHGLMQLMPDTARDPGFGIPPIKDNSNAENLRVGTAYLNAMLRKYNGNLDHALIAYNWGPKNTDNWISEKGADPAKLPKESRDYVLKVKAALGQAPTQVAAAQPPAAAQPVQPTQLAQAPTGTATDVTAPTTGPSAYYLSNPQAIGGDMQRALRQREELVRLAGMYQRSGMGMQFMEARAQLMELDENMYYLQGMQGIQEFSLANDPRRLSAVWSHFAGVPVGVQPRSDGKFDIVVNGQRTQQGLSAAEITNQARLSFDSAFRQQQATEGAKAKEDAFKAQLEKEKKYSEQQAMMIRDIAVEQTRGNNQLALEWAKATYGWDIKPTGAGDGTVIIRPPGASPYLFNPSGRTIKIDGELIKPNSAYPIAGLPSYGGKKP